MTATTVPSSPGPREGPGLGESAAADHAITLTWAEFTREIRQAAQQRWGGHHS